MRTVERRINPAGGTPHPVARQQIVASLYEAGENLAFDARTCIQILRDAGHIDPASAICLLDFTHIPGRLSAAELTWCLRASRRRTSPRTSHPKPKRLA